MLYRHRTNNLITAAKNGEIIIWQFEKGIQAQPIMLMVPDVSQQIGKASVIKMIENPI